MGFWSFLGSSSKTATELPDLFPLSIAQDKFTDIDVKTIYTRILTDVCERTSGLSEDQKKTLYDSCLKSENNHGLITLLAEAISNQQDLCLVYKKELSLVRKATPVESAQIKADYAKENKSKVGIYVSFANYDKALLVRIYSALEYCVVSALNKGMNISMALQIAIKELRSTVNLTDSAIAINQAKEMATALQNGKPIIMDVEDAIRNAMPDLTSVEKAMAFIQSKRAWYLGMPSSYNDGEQTGGMNASGEIDTKAVERGLKNYYVSVIQPVFQELFGVKTKYKSQDMRQISQGLAALKDFELVSEEYISFDEKRAIIRDLFDLDESGDKDLEKPDEVEPPVVTTPVIPEVEP